MNRKQKKQIVEIAKKVAKKIVRQETKRIKKQVLQEVRGGGNGGVPQTTQQPHHKQQQPQPQQQQQQTQQPQRPGQAQPAGQQGDGLSQFKQIQESMFQQGMNPAGEGGPTAGGAGPSGGQMSEEEMVQYAENLDPNGAGPNVQPNPQGGTIQQGQNESRQQFMQRLQQATGGKDPKKIFEKSEESSSDGGWRPGQNK